MKLSGIWRLRQLGWSLILMRSPTSPELKRCWEQMPRHELCLPAGQPRLKCAHHIQCLVSKNNPSLMSQTKFQGRQQQVITIPCLSLSLLPHILISWQVFPCAEL